MPSSNPSFCVYEHVVQTPCGASKAVIVVASLSVPHVALEGQGSGAA